MKKGLLYFDNKLLEISKIPFKGGFRYYIKVIGKQVPHKDIPMIKEALE